MKSFGELLKYYRIKNELPLRKVAAQLDIDTSILSKIERGERQANKSIVCMAAKIFELEESDLITEYYSDIIAKKIYLERTSSEILSVAKSKIKYLKQSNNVQSELKFDND